MFSIVCLFAWLPRHYDFRDAIMKVFNITAGQLVSIRKKRQHNIVIFSVASQEIFNSLSEFYCQVVLFPIMGLNVLECFAYPNSPQYQFISMSGISDWVMAGTQITALSGLGTVLYQCHLIDSLPHFRTDRIGMVLRRRNETNHSVARAADPHSRQRRRGNGEELEAAVGRVANVPVLADEVIGGTTDFAQEENSAAGWQRPFWMQHSVPWDIRRRRDRSGHRNYSSWMELLYSALAPQEPSSEVERPTEIPTAEAPRAILAPQEPSSEYEHASETPTAEDQNPESSSDKQE